MSPKILSAGAPFLARSLREKWGLSDYCTSTFSKYCAT